MSVRIYYGKLLSVPLADRVKFEDFIKVCAVISMRKLLKDKREYLEPLFHSLDLTYNEVYKQIPNLIEIRSLIYSFILGFTHNDEMTTKLKMIDFGSQITGLPKLLFISVFHDIKEHIAEYYLKYLGMVK